MSDLRCDMCGKESVGRGGLIYVHDPLTDRSEIGHLEGWIVLGPACLDLMESIVKRNFWKRTGTTALEEERT